MLDLLRNSFGEVTVPEFSLVTVAIAAAGLLRWFVGFGASLLIVMVVGTVLAPQIAVPVACLSGIPSMLKLLPDAVRYADRSFVAPFGVISFIAAPIGTMILVVLDPVLMRMAISVFILSMVAMLFYGWQFKRRPGLATILAWGIGAGLVQGAAGVGGPPAVVISLSQPGSVLTQRANVLGTVSVLTICSLIPLWFYGLITGQVIAFALVLAPIYFASTWFSARYFARQGRQYYRDAALLTLAVTGIVTFAIAVTDYVSRL